VPTRFSSAIPILVSVALLSIAIALTGPAAALAGHPVSGSEPLTEAQLHSLEADLLGPRHAAEHARARARAREGMGSGEFLAPVTGLPLGQTGELSESEYLTTAPTADAATKGAWSAPFALPLYSIHAALLPTGKVMFFGPPAKRTETNWSHAILWDPVTGQQELVNPPLAPDPMDGGKLKPANIYCSGQALLADGQLLLAGGTLDRLGPGGVARGLKKVYSFNPFDKTWTEQPDMAEGRWYPTQTLLPDGRQVIISGAKVFENDEDPADDNNTIEIFNPAPNRNQQGTITELSGVRGVGAAPPHSNGELYPHMFVMPSGRTLVAGPDPADSWYLETPGGDGAPIEWEPAPDGTIRRTYGNSVLLPPPPGATTPSNTVMQIGGFTRGTGMQPALDSTEVLAENGSSWVKTNPDLNMNRAHQNTVLLPDGSMVAVGGGPGGTTEDPDPFYGTTEDHKQVELYDPTAAAGDRWRLGAAQADARAYHSVAVLLPDGRVISAGDDGNTPKSIAHALDTAEVYEPPYLFKGPRPTISWSPSATSWGRKFAVQTPNAGIDRAVLIAPGATTHAADMHQRYVPLELEHRSQGGVELTAPANANVAPPGYYMLFLVNDAGVPSIAKFILLMPNAPVEHEPGGGDTDTPPGGGDTNTPPGSADPHTPPGGTPPVQQPDVPLDVTSPRVAGLRLGSRTLRAAASRRLLRGLPARTLLSYRLSEPAAARFTIQRAIRTRRGALRYRRMRGAISRLGVRGANSFLFRPRLNGRALRPGRYRLTLVATDVAGNTSSAKRLAFRVVRR
jgi:Domain of unknown function (DUF1929)/Glyoxal oxidase N-terminus